MRRVLALAGGCVGLGIALLFQQGYLLAAAAPADPASPVFEDVSYAAGLRLNRAASLEMAIGQAWGDYDQDGWPDLYVTDPAGPNTLYHNQGDGTFAVSPLAASVALTTSHSAGATWADYDNDGWPDLIVMNWGRANLFHNEAGRALADVTALAGLTQTGNGKSASWGDFDSDGYLDLFIANWACYPECGRPVDGDYDHLYRNNGDGTFTDVSAYLRSGLNGASFIASFNDYDNDGDLDIYLVNDEFINAAGNKLWRNDGAGCAGGQSPPAENRGAVLPRPPSGREGWCFTPVASEAGANSRLFGMGLAVGDYDNDGHLDYYYSNAGPAELLHNQGDGTFTEVAARAGVQSPDTIAWGTVFLDYDNDGWRDLYLAVADTTNHKDVGANRLFRNNADGTFSGVVCNNAATDVHASLGVAYADYNRDGWVDLVVGNMDNGYRLYQNQAGHSAANHWLALELVGAGPVNRDAVGARVYVTTPGGPTQMQDVINGSSLGAGNELTQYFGLGTAATAEVAVRWPDGRRQTFTTVAGDRRYRLTYPVTGASTLQAQPVRAAPLTRRPAVGSAPAARPIEWPGLLITASGLGLGLALALRRHRFWAGGLALASVAGLAAAGALAAGWLTTDDTRLSALLAQADVRVPTNPPAPAPALVTLGEALFWDPELSGNRDIACATCHHPAAATGDNLSVSIGTRGQGLGAQRVRLEERRDFIPRNAQPLFNLGYLEWTVLFWDGRVSGSPAAGFHTPAFNRLPAGLDNLLAAQAMFPVTSRDEMRGLLGDVDVFGQPNELAVISDYTSRPIWEGLMRRLLAIPGYVDLFQAAYPDLALDQLTFAQAANALAAYEIVTFTFEDSPYDRYLRGELQALTPAAKRGALLFYGEAGCASCHSGGLLTDQQFHNLAVPQIGDGKGREQPFDLGRARETGNDCDRYAFRTPPLRGVALSGPWMHDGAFTTLEGAIRHHLDPVSGLINYDPAQLAVALRDTCQNQPDTLAAILKTKSPAASEQARLSAAEMQDLLAFMDALTAPSALDLVHTVPASVPSGLPVGGNLQNQPVGVSGARP